MRKLIVSLAAASAAVAFAAPAAAQYYPQQQPYAQSYGAPYGNAYGYNNRGQLQNELQRIRYQANNLARQGRLTRSESRDLFRDIDRAERSLYRSNRPWEANQKIANLRAELRRYADYDGRNGRYGNGYNNYNNGYANYDRDRDGRDDRYEDDQGTRHDR